MARDLVVCLDQDWLASRQITPQWINDLQRSLLTFRLRVFGLLGSRSPARWLAGGSHVQLHC